MYAPGKILVMGGGGERPPPPPTNTAEVIDLNDPSPTWRDVGPMAFGRRQLNATLLPDGTVLVTGGTSKAGFNTADDSTSLVHAAELWDPATEQWTTLASTSDAPPIGTGLSIPRIYHSSALLLPDGAGLDHGRRYPGLTPADTTTSEIYSPPYLFKGARPTIDSALPEIVAYGQTFFVGTPDATAISKVTMLRLSSVTHSFNMSQYISTLSFSQATGGLNVVAPSGAAVASPSAPTVAPPGPYLLFILNGIGVPSVGRIVQVGSGLPAAPTLTSLSPSTVVAGGPNFPLTVTGSNFVSGSVVQWNGAARTPTTFLNANQLTATITAQDIAAQGTASVTVQNPGGATSSALPFTITQAPAPTPTLTSLSPSTVVAGGPNFTLTVTGSNFVSGSVVQWNGAARTPTTFVNANQLTATITAQDIAAQGTASVTVQNPRWGDFQRSALYDHPGPGANANVDLPLAEHRCRRRTELYAYGDWKQFREWFGGAVEWSGSHPHYLR